MARQIISFSELDTVRQCPHKWQLSYVERWSKPPQEGGALDKGSLWHAVMEAHYQVLQATQGEWVSGRAHGTHPVTTAERLDAAEQAAMAVLFERGKDDTVDLVEWMYRGHVDAYQDDPTWEIVGVEHPAVFWLPTLAGTRSSFQIKQKIDLVVKVHSDRAKPKIWIVDHKSCRNLPKQKNLDFNDQFGLYTWGLRSVGRTVFGSIHSAARTERLKTREMTTEERFLRTPLYRTDTELDNIAREAYLDAINARRSLTARGGADLPRHANEDTCNWRCDFRDACLLGRKTTGEQEREFLRAKGFVQEYTRH